MKRAMILRALMTVAVAGGLSARALEIRYAYDDAGRLLQADYGGGQTIAGIRI